MYLEKLIVFRVDLIGSIADLRRVLDLHVLVRKSVSRLLRTQVGLLPAIFVTVSRFASLVTITKSRMQKVRVLPCMLLLH